MKLKNNDLVPQIFIAVVGVILAGVIIFYVMNSVKSTTRLADNVIASTENTASDYAEYDILMYDGEQIRGSEVVNFIKKQLGDYSILEEAPIYVEVVTIAPTTNYSHIYVNNKHIVDIKNFSSTEYYIKPTAIFTGEVIRTENMVIVGVRFIQN